MRKPTYSGSVWLGVAALTSTVFGFAPCAQADVTPSMFTLSGFGTLGVTHSSLDTADFTSTAFEPNGAGHSHDYDFSDDSKLGLQLTGQFTKQLSAVVQVVSQHQYDNSFTPYVEWANLKYAFTPDFSVRVGRIEVPTFLNSDYRDVGYANPWVRVPAEIYNTEPFTNSDGADASYRFHIGEAANTVKLLYGHSSFYVSPGFKAQVQDIAAVFDTIEYQAFTAHFGMLHAKISLSVLPQESATGYSMAAGYDPGTWFVQAELARITVNQITPGYFSGYVSAGYRINKFTPFVTYAQAYSLGHSTMVPNLNLGQKDASCGVRWDFRKDMDLKFQYDHVWLPSNSTGMFTAVQPTFQLGSGTNVLSVALDFVF